MKDSKMKIHWPNGSITYAVPGSDWISTARKAGILIPTGCLKGSCGACEIEINGQVIRACVSTITAQKSSDIVVEFFSDPFW